MKSHQRLTTEQFIKRARLIHGDRYDYSKVKYVGLTKPVIVICRDHGEFKLAAAAHVRGDARRSSCVQREAAV